MWYAGFPRAASTLFLYGPGKVLCLIFQLDPPVGGVILWCSQWPVRPPDSECHPGFVYSPLSQSASHRTGSQAGQKLVIILCTKIIRVAMNTYLNARVPAQIKRMLL